MVFDKFHEECGVFGIFGHSDAANLTYLGLYALQQGLPDGGGKGRAEEGSRNRCRDLHEMRRLPGELQI